MSLDSVSKRKGIFEAGRKAADNGSIGNGEAPKQIQWGTDVDESLKLDKKKLREAIEKEEQKWRDKEANQKGLKSFFIWEGGGGGGGGGSGERLYLWKLI